MGGIAAITYTNEGGEVMAYVERKLEMIAWDTKGVKLEGRLLRVEKVQYKDGVSLRYILEAGQHILVVPGATQLNFKLRREDIGCNVYVEYLGEDETRQVSADKNRPKLFKVMVDAASKIDVAPADYVPPITDADIPF
jgi:hypothetical protein